MEHDDKPWLTFDYIDDDPWESWQQWKALIAMLQRRINVYEERTMVCSGRTKRQRKTGHTTHFLGKL
jgi:hypothetical protein